MKTTKRRRRSAGYVLVYDGGECGLACERCGRLTTRALKYFGPKLRRLCAVCQPHGYARPYGRANLPDDCTISRPGIDARIEQLAAMYAAVTSVGIAEAKRRGLPTTAADLPWPDGE